MPTPDDEDEPPPIWESWMTAQSEVHLFRQDADADARRARLARAVLDEKRRQHAIEEGRRSAERTWNAILANLRRPYGPA